MSSRHLVDPELLPMLDRLPQVALSQETLPAFRSRETALPLPSVVPNAVTRRDVAMRGPPGAPDIGLVIYTPAGAGPFGCIYHIHGGGYVSGSAGSLEFMHRPLAEQLGCVIVSVDYRLAPETCFPGNIEDCHAGLVWVFKQADMLNVDRDRIGVMGESAGGGLAAALALLVRDRGEHRLAFQVLTYPMLDDRTCTADPHPFAGEFLWTPRNNAFGWTCLLGHAPRGEGVSPYAAPARAVDLSGLPPTFMMTGALDLFVDENIDYARRLIRDGVPTEFHLYPGAFHAFDAWPDAQVSEGARTNRSKALRRLLGRQGTQAA
ncbi:alpha/beta hydrolase [Sphingomonas sp. ID1715]|uniref:alpha/beta hydrolase n=1 Tax=Sphingomonas sp. ID1715 TaxID=1656898 RepID=UPI001488010B|nr:alpha/beta hydrolase [Sphingomonas sp. ID1715]NNM76481.1 alpha/beta hydrolase [Sphingomonas sp. ID1715]